MSDSRRNGVRPAACTSPTSGNEIFPSDRTGIEREISGSFQTLIANTSSLPITKESSCALGAVGSAFWVACADGAGGVAPRVVCAPSPSDRAKQIRLANAPLLQALAVIAIATPLSSSP